jgi:hypothetical protein
MEEERRMYIHRGNQQHGPYGSADVRAWLSSGQILPTDLACYEGSTDWIQVYSLPNMQVPLPMQPQPAPGGSGVGLMISGSVLGVLGALLCITIIGAILGIPMMIGGLVMVVVGRAKYTRRIMSDLKESVRVGVIQGMLPQAPPTAPLAVQPQQLEQSLPAQPSRSDA